MRRKYINTETYEYENGYYVDVVYDGETYEAWLYHECIGIKTLMISIAVPFKTNILLSYIEANIKRHIDDYEKRFIKKGEQL